MVKRIVSIVLVLCISMSMVLFAASPVLAMDFREGETVIIASGEEVNEDLYILGNDITINGTVNGDVLGLGRTLTINGKVNGSVSFAGQYITINGEVSHSARFAGQTIFINGKIDNDLMGFGSSVDIAGTGGVGNDLILGAGTSRINGEIGRNIKGGGGEITISNSVGGDIELEADRLKIASTAQIKGNLIYTSENEAVIESGARVGGETTHKIPEAKEPAPKTGILAGIAGIIWGKILAFLMILIIGIIVILIAPRRIVSMSEAIRTNPWQSLGWGALMLCATPVAIIIVMVTLIGIPLGLIIAAFYGIAIYLSNLPVALLIGYLIINRGREIESKGLLIGALALGLVILAILGIIPVVGFLVGLATVLFGLGSLISSVRKLRAEPV